ncbi:MAG: hypothetical protein KAT91_03025, partial [Candidatus Aenigmarchaeota archaeon]|nr:hypothetical protein [Candidatus Aenigmarchaeota archaeon]
RFCGHDYFIAILWGDNGEKIVDFLGAGEPTPWNSNAEYNGAVITEQGFLEKGTAMYENPITCGDGLIVGGSEEAHRRTTKDLEDYMNQSPVLGIPKITRI